MVQVALRTEEIKQASRQDEDLKVVQVRLQSGDWSKVPKDFAVVCNELTYLGQVGLQGIRIVIPEKLQRRVLELAHEGHQGIVNIQSTQGPKYGGPGSTDTPRSNIESVLNVS